MASENPVVESKANAGNFFEDFTVGQVIVHAVPRTVTDGDVSLYTALYGGRFALNASTPFAQANGYAAAPIDSMLAFHLVFGKTVPDISLNAIANLGYAHGVFGQPVFPGDTISTTSTVIGVRETKDAKTGVVYVRSVGVNQHKQMILDYVRWALVRKRDASAPAPWPVIPELADAVPFNELKIHIPDPAASTHITRTGSSHHWEDYAIGERIDHVDGMTIEDAEHMMAARLYHNTARVHFNQHVEREGRFGKRIVYGGHIISIARALSFNGLSNGMTIAAINGGRHTNPTFAGDTVYSWSEVIDRGVIPGRDDIGVLRLRTVATKDLACATFPYQKDDGSYHPNVVLDFDYTVTMRRR